MGICRLYGEKLNFTAPESGNRQKQLSE